MELACFRVAFEPCGPRTRSKEPKTDIFEEFKEKKELMKGQTRRFGSCWWSNAETKPRLTVDTSLRFSLCYFFRFILFCFKNINTSDCFL